MTNRLATMDLSAQAELALQHKLFARLPLSRIPLIELRNTLRVFGVPIPRAGQPLPPDTPTLALLAAQEIRRRLLPG